MRRSEVGGGWVARGPEKCKVMRGGTSGEENLGEVGQLGVWGGCMEGRVRRCVLIKTLLLCSFKLASHGGGGRRG